MPGLTASIRTLMLSLSAGILLASSVSASVVRTFHFSAADLQVGVEEHGYATYALKGGASWGQVGGPELPGLSVLVDLPQGTRATSVRAVASQFVSVGSGARAKPAQPPTPGIERPVWRDPDASLYAESAWIPGQVAQLGPSGAMRGRALASIVLSPLQLSPATGAARLATQIEITVETTPESQPLVRRRVVREWEEIVDRGFEASLAQGPAAVHQGLEPARSWTSASTFPLARRETAVAPSSDSHPTPFSPSALPSVVGSPVQYLIITNEAMKTQFQTLADWKTEQGCPAVVRTVEFLNQNYPFGFDLADRVRRFIRDAYTQWGTVWVLLGGDTPVIPVRYARTTFFGGENLATDLYYSDLDGNWDADGDSLFGEGFIDSNRPGDALDLLPDVYVSRAPVENVSQAQLFVNKVLIYNQNPASGYLCKALFFAEVLFPQDWQPGQAIASDGATIAEHAIQRMTGCMATGTTRLYENYTAYPGAIPLSREAVLDSINAGYNLLHHVGHGFRNTMSCGDASITNADITPLSNSPKNAGLLYAIDCTSGAIDFESIGEEFVLAPNGGSISDIGSTHFDFPATGDGYQNEFYNEVFQDGITQLGLAQAMQKVPFVAFSGFDNVQRWTQMTVLMLGDPELSLWTEQPVTLTVTFPATVSIKDTSVTVTVQRLGSPLPGAKVCLLKGSEEYRFGTTNGSGQVTLSFRPDTQGTAKITVTSGNCIPFRSTFTVGPAASNVALVTLPQDRVIVDTGGALNGNGNSSLDAGERVDLTIPVKNAGGVLSGVVSGTLLSLDGRVTVPVPAGSYGAIGAGATTSGTPYRIELTRNGFKDGDEVHLRLSLSDGASQWREEEYLTVRVPDLRHLKHVLNDGGAGNGDQILDIGETADYTVTLVNTTEGPARGVTALLTAATSGVTVLDGTSTYGSIAGRGQAAGDVFRIRNDSQAVPKFTLTVSDFYTTLFTQTIDFSFPQAPVGVIGEGSATSIQLVWALSPSSDLSGYNVYRSQSQGGPFARRDSLPSGRVAFFQDEGLAPLTRYYYYVTSVDSSANESAPSPVISASTNPANLNGFPIPMGRTTPSSPAVGDLERDGQLEAVVGSDYLYAWHSDGHGVIDADGSERTSGDFTTLGSYYASAPAITDLDHDGVMDIVALDWDSTPTLYVFEPDGSLKFSRALLDGVWSSPACGDIDGDGFEEIVFNSNGPRVYAFHYDGTEVRDGDSDPGTVGVFATVASPDNYGSPALADLDGDGKLDIIAPARDGRIYAWKFDGSNVPGFPYGPFSPFLASPAVGDIDNDGLLDIVCPAENNRLYCVQQNGVARPGFPVIGMPSSGVSRAPSPALVDMDGNGTREIVCAGTDGNLRILKTDGTPYPGWGAVRYTAKTAGASESSPVAADIDNNGHIDILIGSEDGQLYGFKDDGTPLAGFPIHLDGEVRGTPMIWDFDQDGDAEILLAGWDKNFYVWTYPGTYVPRPDREWVMFRHDSQRTGRLGPAIVVGVESAAASAQTEAIDGGVRLRWKVPAEGLADGALWRAFRIDGPVSGTAQVLQSVPEGYRPVGSEVAAEEGGWLTVDDYTVTPGASYGYVLARVETAPATDPLAYGPYSVLAPSAAPGNAYLAGAYPNPGRSEQTLAYGLPDGLPQGTIARLDLYDLRGAHVRSLVHREATSGRFVIHWDGRADDGRSVPAGIYLYQLTAGPYTLGGRLVRLQP